LIIGAPGATISEDGQNALNPNGDEVRPSFERKKRAHRRTHGKISFSDLAKRIGQMWNSLDANDRRRFEVGAGKCINVLYGICLFHKQKNKATE
jgi:hypothetical protein